MLQWSPEVRGSTNVLEGASLVLDRADVSLIGCFIHEAIQLCRVGNGHLHQPTYDDVRQN